MQQTNKISQRDMARYCCLWRQKCNRYLFGGAIVSGVCAVYTLLSLGGASSDARLAAIYVILALIAAVVAVFGFVQRRKPLKVVVVKMQKAEGRQEQREAEQEKSEARKPAKQKARPTRVKKPPVKKKEKKAGPGILQTVLGLLKSKGKKSKKEVTPEELPLAEESPASTDLFSSKQEEPELSEEISEVPDANIDAEVGQAIKDVEEHPQPVQEEQETETAETDSGLPLKLTPLDEEKSKDAETETRDKKE